MSSEDEIERLRAALAFYRDGFFYEPKRSKTGIDLSEWKPKEALLEDCGNRALEALTPPAARPPAASRRPEEENEAYRDAMKDAGRGHLLR